MYVLYLSLLKLIVSINNTCIILFNKVQLNKISFNIKFAFRYDENKI